MTTDPGIDRPSGDAGPPPGRRPGGLGAWAFGAWIGTLVALLIVFAWMLGKDEGERQAERGTPTQQAAPAPAETETTAAAPAAEADPGRQAFATKCGGCHTLAAADSHGAVGPDLDDLKADEARVLAAIRNGGSGAGGMPANLAQGGEAEQIAAFVAQAAGGG
ncbi:MAG TPA: cytochrome c [Capillimicrobium sp.]|nr:cytochrome c [Capillimicrobium sp.]